MNPAGIEKIKIKAVPQQKSTDSLDSGVLSHDGDFVILSASEPITSESMQDAAEPEVRRKPQQGPTKYSIIYLSKIIGDCTILGFILPFTKSQGEENSRTRCKVSTRLPETLHLNFTILDGLNLQTVVMNFYVRAFLTHRII